MLNPIYQWITTGTHTLWYLMGHAILCAGAILLLHRERSRLATFASVTLVGVAGGFLSSIAGASMFLLSSAIIAENLKGHPVTPAATMFADASVIILGTAQFLSIWYVATRQGAAEEGDKNEKP